MNKDYRYNSFLLFTEHLETIEMLDEIGQAELLMAIFNYAANKEVKPFTDKNTNIVFIHVRNGMENNDKKYKDKRKITSIAGKLSAEVRKKKKEIIEDLEKNKNRDNIIEIIKYFTEVNNDPRSVESIISVDMINKFDHYLEDFKVQDFKDVIDMMNGKTGNTFYQDAVVNTIDVMLNEFNKKVDRVYSYKSKNKEKDHPIQYATKEGW